MRIEKNTVESIVSRYQSIILKESGGLLGINQDGIVCCYTPDDGKLGEAPCVYTPDVERMNEILLDWARKGIGFGGIYHTHFFGVDTLSPQDKEYIIRILNSMPPEIHTLYFPLLVMPQRELIPYIAKRQEETVAIERDILNIIDGGSYDGKKECQGRSTVPESAGQNPGGTVCG